MSVLRDTADIRNKLLQVWKLVDEKKISAGEARLHISLARAVLETLKVEIAASHLSQAQIPSVSLGKQEYRPVIVQRRQQQ